MATDTAPTQGSNVTCRICLATGIAAEVFERAWTMFRCSHCGSVQAFELPNTEDLARFYDTAYADSYTAGMCSQRFQHEMPLRHAAKLELVKSHCWPGRLLDVGCGEGFFLEQAARAGFDAHGCDYALRSSYPPDVRVRQGRLDAPHGLPFPDGGFDVVTSWAVLEHLRDPRAASGELFRVVRPGGFLFCDTPLCNDVCERNVAARSHWLCPPEHLHVFSAKGLRILLAAAGFVVLTQRPFFERNRTRWMLRRVRNILIGAMVGGVTKWVAPQLWSNERQTRTSQIGDIQLAVAQKPE